MANAQFKVGSAAVPQGQVEFSVTISPALAFTPDSVQVVVRQPSSVSDIISAYVVGTPTASSFTVAISAPVSSADYRIDWVAFKNESIGPSVAGDTLAISYGELKKIVSRFLGYDVTALTTAQTEEVDDCIQSGIRNFYYPANVEGVDPNFEWSFIRQQGSITTETGVSGYYLPTGFGRVLGQLLYNVEQHGPLGGIPIIPYGEVKLMLDRHPNLRGTPRFAATIAQQAFGTRGQAKKMYFFPTPDKAYTFDFVCDADTGKIDAVNRPFPLGGAMYSEVVKESCLAAAEQMSNDEMGLHTQKFAALLGSIAAKDRKASAQDFGRIGDPSGFRW